MTYGWIWIALIVIFAALTVLTRKNILVSVTVGALAPLIMDIFQADIIFQVIVFVAATVVCAIIVGTSRGAKSGYVTDSIVGMRCVVLERIDSEAGCGQVMVNGQSWSARAVDETVTYEVGETLKIVAIEGVKLICLK